MNYVEHFTIMTECIQAEQGICQCLNTLAIRTFVAKPSAINLRVFSCLCVFVASLSKKNHLCANSFYTFLCGKNLRVSSCLSVFVASLSKKNHLCANSFYTFLCDKNLRVSSCLCVFVAKPFILCAFLQVMKIQKLFPHQSCFLHEWFAGELQ